MEHTAGEVVKRRTALETGHLDVAESVVREVRLKLLGTLAGADIAINLPIPRAEVSGVEVVHVNRPVRVEHFVELHRHLGVGCLVHPHAAPASNVLAEVEHIDARLGLSQGNWLDLLGGSDTLMLGHVLWDEFFANRAWPIASAVAIVMLLMVLGLLVLQNKVNRPPPQA